ncbi:folate-binding YgfZ domain protein [Mycobacterium xenopi 4042]|uniref:Folate-binding YgfZ domain protein n=1 Tax=Mycobacterium xenopi 4042 TaxID=1299334 RepID=X7ZU72_MYCXE|nr:folate-binding YgfZ domain protein [Mycobacterium xenopi 4042]
MACDRSSRARPRPDAGAVWHYGDPFGEQRAAATEAVVVDRSHRP